MKRILAALLALCLLISVLPANVFAAEIVASGTEGDNLTWVLTDDGVLTISGTGAMTDFFFPAPCSSVYTVIIESGVTTISHYAFCNFSVMTNVTIPSSVISIGATAFGGCSSLTSIAISDKVTTIGRNAFRGCKNLTGIWVDNGNPNYSSDAYGVLFDKDKTLLIQAPGALLGTYAVPDSVTSIGDYAFFDCDSLTNVEIGNSVTSIGDKAFSTCVSLTSADIGNNVTSIGDYAFKDCISLKEIKFMCNGPAIGLDAFYNITATAYYPAGDSTWTSDVMQDYGGTITWVPYTPEVTEDPPCSLDELTEADYLAFAAIVYENFDDYYPDTANSVWHTVQDAMTGMGKWDSADWADGITYADLCAHIANWKVMRVINHSYSNGFYSVAFVNDNNEVVIAYRGSEDIKKTTSDFDAFCDWIQNDFPMEVFNTVITANQYSDAFEMYEDVVTAWNPTQVAVTGHSLGGGLGDMVSARYGCKGVTMNAISVLDAIYDHAPEEMGFTFWGVDEWNFVDHTNAYDMIAGMFEHYFSTEMKPYVAHNTNIDVSVIDSEEGLDLLGAVEDILECHSLPSYVSVGSDGAVDLTGVISNFSPAEVITNQMTFTNRSIDFGTSNNDRIDKGLSVTNARTIYGGDGGDTLIASTLNDTLIGGPIGDDLDGGWGNDKYYYFKGDGVDYIHDTDGSDILYLYGFADDDIIEVYEDSDSDYIEVHCNGDIIVKISKKNREYALVALDHFKIILENGKEYDITDAFYKYTSGSHLLITCPVDVLIVDADGNVVYTLEDGVVGSHYTDYGNFYVFEEEDGSYGKVLDLAEGYSVKIDGTDSGVMDISVWNVIEGNLSEEAYSVTDVPVSDSFIGTIEETDEGETILIVDSDGDGITDSEHTFKLVHEHSYTEAVTPPTCTEQGFTTYTCSICDDSYVADYVEALGHEFKNGYCQICGEPDPDYDLPVDPSSPTEPEEPSDPVDPEEPALDGVIRVAGADRIETSLKLADQLKELLGVEKFDSVIVTYSQNFPDALTGSYLAAEKSAPILLTNPSAHARIRAYIRENLVPGGTVYILGGVAAVSDEFTEGLTGFTVKRVAGSDRFETNLKIMEEAGNYAGKPVLIATGMNFADSLSASAAGLPMVLVHGSLRPDQKAFLKTTSRNFVIIGGTAAVSESLEKELKAIGSVERLAGASRYETSVLVAERFVQNPDAVILAYAKNFPDGLCGGPLAYVLGAPLILTDNSGYSAADAYVKNIKSGIVAGGTILISDTTVRAIFDLTADTTISAG